MMEAAILKPTIRVVCALLEREGRLLVSQRPRNGSNASLWEFPGGKVRQGETNAQALRRELEEELGIRVQVAETHCVLLEERVSDRLELCFLWCSLTEDQVPQCLEVQSFAWALPSELLEFPMTPSDRRVGVELSAKWPRDAKILRLAQDA